MSWFLKFILQNIFKKIVFKQSENENLNINSGLNQPIKYHRSFTAIICWSPRQPYLGLHHLPIGCADHLVLVRLQPLGHTVHISEIKLQLLDSSLLISDGDFTLTQTHFLFLFNRIAILVLPLQFTSFLLQEVNLKKTKQLLYKYQNYIWVSLVVYCVQILYSMILSYLNEQLM